MTMIAKIQRTEVHTVELTTVLSQTEINALIARSILSQAGVPQPAEGAVSVKLLQRPGPAPIPGAPYEQEFEVVVTINKLEGQQ